MRRDGLALLLAASLSFGWGANAEPGLMDRNVTFQILTYNDPAQPEFQSAIHSARIGADVEFGLGYEGVQNQLDVVPILVDIGANRIEVRYSNAEPGELWQAKFNGYVLTFEASCNTIQGARIDQKFTNLPMDNKRIRVDGNVLLVNVSAQNYDRESRIGIDLDVTDCPTS